MPKITAAARQERQDAILQATVACLAAHGYSGTTMQAIAGAAGLSKGGLYAYFDSREAILLALAQSYMEQQLTAFAPLPAETAPAQLARIFAAYGQSPATPAAAQEQETVQRAVFDLWTVAGDLPSVRSALLERHRRYRTALTDVIGRGQAEGTFRRDTDPVAVADLILAARDGAVYHAVDLRLPVTPAVLTGLLHTLLAHYLV